MASPQKENGYTSIANELFEALAHIRISGEAMQVLLVIIRKTYGFQKKEDSIALLQFSLATGMSKIAIRKAINKLIIMGIITKKGNDLVKRYCLVKDYSLWKPVPKKVTRPKKVTTETNIGTKRDQKSAHQKKKETITKEIDHQPTLSADVPAFIDLFSLINPTYKKLFGSPPHRKAAGRLLEVHPLEWWKRFMPAYQIALEDRYCPKATTPLQLENKFGDIDAYGRQRKKGQDIKKNNVAFS